MKENNSSLPMMDAAEHLNIAPKQITQDELRQDYSYFQAQKVAEQMLTLGLISLSEFNNLTQINRDTFSPLWVEIMAEIR